MARRSSPPPLDLVPMLGLTVVLIPLLLVGSEAFVSPTAVVESNLPPF